jgi:hypothetical protein
MKYPFSYLIMLFAIALCALPFAQAAEMSERTEGAQMEQAPVNLTGYVKDIQGDLCVVEDSQGNEWQIKVDNYTDQIGDVLPGVTIVAEVEENGHAKEVKVLPE